jgi:hypothetical protein
VPTYKRRYNITGTNENYGVEEIFKKNRFEGACWDNPHLSPVLVLTSRGLESTY